MWWQIKIFIWIFYREKNKILFFPQIILNLDQISEYIFTISEYSQISEYIFFTMFWHKENKIFIVIINLSFYSLNDFVVYKI